MLMDTPVLFLIFNRPSVTSRVFFEIKKAKPARIYIAADGPRANKQTDHKLCDETREVIKGIDWPCQVHTLYREQNLGCKKAVSSAISWFFEHEERGIILEDDCLPHPSFFNFCETMLTRYADDTRVVHITGSNFQKGIKRTDGDYYFSHLTHVWGWASWRRVWKNYDIDMSQWPQFRKEKHLKNIFYSERIIRLLEGAFEKVFANKINTWDYQLLFSNLSQNGLNIIPNSNLISNIGYNVDATHTATQNDEYSNMPVKGLTTFRSPTITRVCLEADLFSLEKDLPPILTRIKRKLFNKAK
jgi:hypothetical protein